MDAANLYNIYTFAIIFTYNPEGLLISFVDMCSVILKVVLASDDT